MKYVFNVQGMTCEHCEKTVIRAIRTLDRSAEVHVDRPANQVEVESSQSAQALTQAIVDEGFSVVA